MAGLRRTFGSRGTELPLNERIAGGISVLLGLVLVGLLIYFVTRAFL